MAFWSIIGTGLGDAAGRTFGLSLDTAAGAWTVGGASVDQFFVTRSGSYRVVVAPERGTRLAGADGGEVEFLRDLTGQRAVGATGTGRAPEKGVTFRWRLDSK